MFPCTWWPHARNCWGRQGASRWMLFAAGQALRPVTRRPDFNQTGTQPPRLEITVQFEQQQPLILRVALGNADVAAIAGAQLQERYWRVFVHDAVAGLLVFSNRAIRVVPFRRDFEIMAPAQQPIGLQ